MKPDRARLFKEAFITGVIGYLAVALFFVVWNLAAGRPALYTANLLGQGIVRAPYAGGDAAVSFGPVVAYNAMHLIVFLLIGLLAAVLVLATEKAPQFWFVAVLIFVTALMASIAVVVAYAIPISAALPWWSIVAANVVAAVLMGAYMVRAHPRLMREIAEIH